MLENYDKKTSWFAKASLVCLGIAILSVMLFVLSVVLPMEDAGPLLFGGMIFFPLAFVLSVVAVIHIVVCRKQVKGLVVAIVVIVLSIPPICVVNGTRLIAKARSEREKDHTCKYNLRLLGKELIKYAKDNDGHFPIAENWCDSLIEYNEDVIKNTFKHPLNPIFNPSTKSRLHPDLEATVQQIHPSFKLPTERKLHLEGECNFAFNKNLSGLSIEDITDDTVLIWEANGTWNLNGGSELLNTRQEDGIIQVLLMNQKIVTYYFDQNGYRTFSHGDMDYRQLRWNR